MIALSLEQLADVVGGELVDPGAGGRAIEDVVIDSRRARPGSLFVPLPGQRTDGHRHIGAALRAGASACLVAADRAEAVLAELASQPDPTDAAHRSHPDRPLRATRASTHGGGSVAVVVDDPADALLGLGAWVRQTVDPSVIAVTGSSGKTTVKDLTAAAVAARRVTVANEGSYNNELGVPLTCCRLELSSEVLVAEIGARGLGHIASLAHLVAPDVAIVTTVGAAHLGMFGSVETTARAKSELVQALAPGGTAILNADDDRVAAMAPLAEAVGARTVTYGLREGADWQALDIELDAQARPAFTVRGVRLRVPLPGEHNIGNALAALVAADAVGVDLAAAAHALEHASVSRWRMELATSRTGITVLNDAYNANPASCAAALRTLLRVDASGRRWAVLGHMAELGDASESEHAALGRLAAQIGVDALVVVGPLARPLHAAAAAERSAWTQITAVEDPETAISVLRDQLRPGDAVLVKASRSAGLERIAAALLDDAPGDGDDR